MALSLAPDRDEIRNVPGCGVVAHTISGPESERLVIDDHFGAATGNHC